MYELLSTKELATLQVWLFEGTEEAFRVACATGDDPGWWQRRPALHRELAALFIEAGTELFQRLDRYCPQIA
jgi:hypothetical protein